MESGRGFIGKEGMGYAEVVEAGDGAFDQQRLWDSYNSAGQSYSIWFDQAT